MLCANAFWSRNVPLTLEEESGDTLTGFDPTSATSLDDLGAVFQHLGSTACLETGQTPLLTHSFARLRPTETRGHQITAQNTTTCGSPLPGFHLAHGGDSRMAGSIFTSRD